MNDKIFITKNITHKEIYKLLKNVEEQVLKTNGTVGWHTNVLWGLFILICGLMATCAVI